MPSNYENLYTILDVDSNTERSGIRKKYKQLALVHHPDKGGNEEDFKKIQTALGILQDDTLREIYDILLQQNINHNQIIEDLNRLATVEEETKLERLIQLKTEAKETEQRKQAKEAEKEAEQMKQAKKAEETEQMKQAKEAEKMKQKQEAEDEKNRLKQESLNHIFTKDQYISYYITCLSDSNNYDDNQKKNQIIELQQSKKIKELANCLYELHRICFELAILKMDSCKDLTATRIRNIKDSEVTEHIENFFEYFYEAPKDFCEQALMNAKQYLPSVGNKEQGQAKLFNQIGQDALLLNCIKAIARPVEKKLQTTSKSFMLPIGKAISIDDNAKIKELITNFVDSLPKHAPYCCKLFPSVHNKAKEALKTSLNSESCNNFKEIKTALATFNQSLIANKGRFSKRHEEKLREFILTQLKSSEDLSNKTTNELITYLEPKHIQQHEGNISRPPSPRSVSVTD